MITYNINHVNGLFFEIINDEGKNREYDVIFYDKEYSKSIYETKLKIGTWSKLDRKYLSDIAIIVKFEGRIIKQINFPSLYITSWKI